MRFAPPPTHTFFDWCNNKKRKRKEQNRKMHQETRMEKARFLFSQYFWGCQNELGGMRPQPWNTKCFHLTVWTTYFKHRDHPQFSHSLSALFCCSWTTEATSQNNPHMLEQTYFANIVPLMLRVGTTLPETLANALRKLWGLNISLWQLPLGS